MEERQKQLEEIQRQLGRFVDLVESYFIFIALVLLFQTALHLYFQCQPQ